MRPQSLLEVHEEANCALPTLLQQKSAAVLPDYGLLAPNPRSLLRSCDPEVQRGEWEVFDLFQRELVGEVGVWRHILQGLHVLLCGEEIGDLLTLPQQLRLPNLQSSIRMLFTEGQSRFLDYK